MNDRQGFEGTKKTARVSLGGFFFGNLLFRRSFDHGEQLVEAGLGIAVIHARVLLVEQRIFDT